MKTETELLIDNLLKYWHTYTEDEIELIKNKLTPLLNDPPPHITTL